MEYTKSELYELKIFRPGELLSTVQKVLALCGVEIEKCKFKAGYSAKELGSWDKELKIEEIHDIYDFVNFDVNSLRVYFLNEDSSYLSFSTVDDRIYISSSQNSSALLLKSFELVRSELDLKTPPEDTSDGIDVKDQIELLNQRILTIESQLSNKNRRLKCFLSFRFDQKNNAYALELTRYLNLLGVEIVSGAGYEPRRISEKVISRISQDIDFIVYLVTNSGESMWIRDEMAVSVGKGYHIIPVIEEGASMEKGILGDWEYIPLSVDHIGDSFIRIIEAVHFIRAERNIGTDS